MNKANLIAVKNVEVVEVKTSSASAGKIKFPVTENLRSKKIIAVETFRVAKVSNTPLGSALVNDTVFSKSFLTLVEGSKEKIKDLPLSSICAADNNGSIKAFDEIVIDPDKCYISISDANGIVTTESFMIVFYYLD